MTDHAAAYSDRSARRWRRHQAKGNAPMPTRTISKAFTIENGGPAVYQYEWLVEDDDGNVAVHAHVAGPYRNWKDAAAAVIAAVADETEGDPE